MLALGLVACEGFGEDDEGPFCCRWEERNTGCGNKGWGEWRPGETEMESDSLKVGLTPQAFCDTFDGMSTTCAGGCCINIERRNITLESGACF